MWANAEHEGRPAESCAQRRKVWLTPAAGVPFSNTAKIRERKTWSWTESEFCTWQNSVTGQEPPKVYMSSTSPGDGQTSCKVWLACVERRRCSNDAKTRNQLKFAGVPRTTGPISAISGPKFIIFWGHVEEILLRNNPIVDVCLSCKDVVRQTFVRWCPDVKF